MYVQTDRQLRLLCRGIQIACGLVRHVRGTLTVAAAMVMHCLDRVVWDLPTYMYGLQADIGAHEVL